jgi:hypothetical protein
MTFVGTEWSHPLERHLIPALEREYGTNHRVVVRARRAAEDLEEEKMENLRRAMERLNWFRAEEEGEGE